MLADTLDKDQDVSCIFRFLSGLRPTNFK
jgi:hypothetical protein